MLIKRLKIVHFKSIKHLDFSCSRVNLLIGEPNTGKSNILEALGLVSWLQHLVATEAALNAEHAYEWLRVRRGEQLFYFRDTSRKVEIRLEIEDEEGKNIGTKVFKPEEIYKEVKNIPPDLIVYFGDLN